MHSANKPGCMQLLDGKWACSNGGDYPSFSGHLLHPCSHDCCGGAGRAPFVMQLVANFYAPVRPCPPLKVATSVVWGGAR